jgi:hypothetical protein
LRKIQNQQKKKFPDLKKITSEIGCELLGERLDPPQLLQPLDVLHHLLDLLVGLLEGLEVLPCLVLGVRLRAGEIVVDELDGRVEEKERGVVTGEVVGGSEGLDEISGEGGVDPKRT